MCCGTLSEFFLLHNPAQHVHFQDSKLSGHDISCFCHLLQPQPLCAQRPLYTELTMTLVQTGKSVWYCGWNQDHAACPCGDFGGSHLCSFVLCQTGDRQSNWFFFITRTKFLLCCNFVSEMRDPGGGGRGLAGIDEIRNIFKPGIWEKNLVWHASKYGNWKVAPWLETGKTYPRKPGAGSWWHVVQPASSCLVLETYCMGHQNVEILQVNIEGSPLVKIIVHLWSSCWHASSALENAAGKNMILCWGVFHFPMTFRWKAAIIIGFLDFAEFTYTGICCNDLNLCIFYLTEFIVWKRTDKVAKNLLLCSNRWSLLHSYKWHG